MLQPEEIHRQNRIWLEKRRSRIVAPGAGGLRATFREDDLSGPIRVLSEDNFRFADNSESYRPNPRTNPCFIGDLQG